MKVEHIKMGTSPRYASCPVAEESVGGSRKASGSPTGNLTYTRVDFLPVGIPNAYPLNSTIISNRILGGGLRLKRTYRHPRVGIADRPDNDDTFRA